MSARGVGRGVGLDAHEYSRGVERVKDGLRGCGVLTSEERDEVLHVLAVAQRCGVEACEALVERARRLVSVLARGVAVEPVGDGGHVDG